jgi:phage pi2 protein 07
LASGIQYADAQERFQTGYIVDLKGDTVIGEIDNRQWERNPVEIKFRKNPTDLVIVFNQFQIKAFGVAGNNYISALVKVENTSRNVQNLSFSAEPEITTEAAFLKVIVQGPKSLYFYQNRMDIPNFYIYYESEYQLLMYKKYLKKTMNDHELIENKSYLGLLTLYLSDCKNINGKINKTSYNLESLKSLFDAYYYRVSTGSMPEETRVIEKQDYGVRFGVTQTNINIRSDRKYDELLASSRFNPSLNLTAGLFYTIYFPEKFHHWSIKSDLMFDSFKFHFDTLYNYVDAEDYDTYEISLESSQIRVLNMISYTVDIAEVQLSAAIGITTSISVSFVDRQVYGHMGYYGFRSYDHPVFYEDHQIERSGVVGFGASYKRFNLEARFESGKFTPPPSERVKELSRFHFLLGYKF